MSGKTFDPNDRRVHLQALADIPVDADADDQVLATFLPGPQHERALDRRILVVRGERGAGKTALFQLLHAVQSKNISLSDVIGGAPDGRRIDGYAATGTAHPADEVVGQFATKAEPEDVRAFWLGHLVVRLRAERISTEDLPSSFRAAHAAGPLNPQAWVGVARSSLPDLYAWLDRTEQALSEACFVVYDHLDRIGSTNRQVREKVSAGLLGLWMSLSQRYDRVRGKVLVREDLFQATLTSFADATKLEARSVRLDWSAGRLYAMLVRRMAAADGLRDWLKDVARVPLQKNTRLGWLPESVDFDERAQRNIAKALVGAYMGAGPTKGFSHTWLINHLQDAHGRVTPRSLLVLVCGAAQSALERGPKAVYRRLLHPVELQRSLEKASQRRAGEMTEDFPVVGRLEGLRKRELFLSKREVVAALRSVTVK
ncbi:MAG: hypothetical protein ACREJ3_09885, partial [Polyangiaceae bacterium]